MRWTLSLILLIFFVNNAWSGASNNERRGNKRNFLIHFLSNTYQSVKQIARSASSKFVDIIADLHSTIKPFFSRSVATETVRNKSIQVTEETVAAKVINFTFSNLQIHDIEKIFANRMGLKSQEGNQEKIRGFLGSLFDSTTKLLDTDKTSCGLCKFLVKGLQRHTFTVSYVGEFICNIYILLSTLTVSDFCKSIIELNKPALTYIINNSEILDPELACTILLQTKECNYEKPALQWVTAVSKSPPIVPALDLNKIDPNEKPMIILHLSDFHITPDYDIGGVANCGYPVCCKKGLGRTITGTRAYKWGDYNCDIPPWLLGSTLRHLNSTYKNVSMVYFTGDIIDHTIWNSSIDSNTKLIYYTYRVLAETFPDAKIFSVIGNHESTPLNVFSPPTQDLIDQGLSTNWLYKLMAKVWRPWVSSEGLKTVEYQGYYAHSFSSRLKIIGLNNNVCYNFNWWLMYNTEFLNEQLQFLQNELRISEQNGQFVHILGHMTVGNQECIQPWEVSYNAIVQRFAHIIKGQFVGHTHTDEFKIFYDENMKPNNVAFNGASLTPYIKYNPNYKVVYVQPTTMDILDIDTFIFNLTEANLYNDRDPAWVKLYSMKKAYNLTDMTPASFDMFVNRMLKDKKLQEQYWFNYVRKGDPSLKDGCDDSCKLEIACKAVTTWSLHSTKPQCYAR